MAGIAQSLAARVAIVALILCVLASTASAGTLTPGGYAASPPESSGSIYMGIGPPTDEQSYREIGVFENRMQPVQFAGYSAAPSYEEIGPGSCAPLSAGTLHCGLIPSGGEPFSIAGSDGDDNFVEIGCNSLRLPDDTPCPRVFKIALGPGNDHMRMWNFSDSLGDEPDPVTGLRPFVAAGRAPMHGVEIDGGSGNDELILMGGPSSGRIDAGAGDDRIFTRGGYTESAEPVNGGYTIVCGPGFDTVQPGPGDTLAADCERLYSDEEPYEEEGAQPEPSSGSDLASTCGTARFDFHNVAGERGAVRKDRRGCVYLVSNRLARELLRIAYDSDGNVSQAFVDVLAIAAKAAKVADPNMEALNAFVGDAIPLPDGQDIIKRALPGWIQDGLATAERANPLTLLGESVGSLAIPLRTLHRIHQIETKGACLQFVVGVRRGEANVDSRVIYNPRYFSDRSGSYARVHKRKARTFADRYPAKYLNLSCKGNGMVATKPRRDTAAVFRGHRTTTGSA